MKCKDCDYFMKDQTFNMYCNKFGVLKEENDHACGYFYGTDYTKVKGPIIHKDPDDDLIKATQEVIKEEAINNPSCFNCQYYQVLTNGNDRCIITDVDPSTHFHKACSNYEKLKHQEAKADSGKLQITLVPRQIIKDIAEVRMYGNKKYGSPDNWKQVEAVRYRDALMRHLLAYLDDPDSVDEESGIKHLKHIACNVAFLCEMEDKE